MHYLVDDGTKKFFVEMTFKEREKFSLKDDQGRDIFLENGVQSIRFVPPVIVRQLVVNSTSARK